jgi:hypothetical protein
VWATPGATEWTTVSAGAAILPMASGTLKSEVEGSTVATIRASGGGATCPDPLTSAQVG